MKEAYQEWSKRQKKSHVLEVNGEKFLKNILNSYYVSPMC